MLEKKEMNEVGGLSYALIYHRYLMNKGKAQNLFTELSLQQYLLLRRVTVGEGQSKAPLKKTYLRDLAENMELSIHSVSKLVGDMKDKGLVYWSHDGNGSEGTYIIVTEHGKQKMETQEKILYGYYGRVIEKFGKESLKELLLQLERLEEVMKEEE